MRLLLRFVVAAAIACAIPTPVDACSAVAIGLPRPQPELAALSGVVVGIVDVPGPTGAAPAPGLVVMTDAGVDGAPESMHWLPLQVAPDCSPLAWSKQELTDQYPAGVRVVAVGRIVSNIGTSRSITTGANDFGHIARVPGPRLPVAGQFDFGRFRAQHRLTSKGVEGAAPPGDAWHDAQRQWYEQYEFYRAMMVMSRLHDDDRVALLRNLAAYSWFAEADPKYARHEYEALVRWAEVSAKARRPLLREFAHASERSGVVASCGASNRRG